VTTKKDYTEAAACAEGADLELPMGPGTLHGEAAANFGRQVSAKAPGGRPSLTAPGEHSPRRQVRLPQDLSDTLDQRALEEGRTAGAIMREAIELYLRQSA